MELQHLFLVIALLILQRIWLRLALTRSRPHRFWRRPLADPPSAIRSRRKPDWLRKELLRLKAHMPSAGCRKVAVIFNRIHPGATIGKSFVAELIATHQREIAQLRRQIRSAKPRAVRVNNTWAMDLSFFTDTRQRTYAFIGILDHGSRLVLGLQTLTRRCSWTLLGHLCMAIAQHGKPLRLRTDNEPVFNSRVFKTFLRLAGVRYENTHKHAPWQNGRMERLFGTLKPLLRQLVIPSSTVLQAALDEFRDFYNHVWPHQNLQGLTPAEHFTGLRPVDLQQMPVKQATPVQALAGLMRGYWIRR